MSFVKTVVLCIAALSLVACSGVGKTVSNKQDAAEVLQMLAGMGASAKNGSTKSLAKGVATTQAINVTGKTGTMTGTMTVDTAFGTDTIDVIYNMDLVFDGYSPDGVNTFDGTEKLGFTMHGAGSAAQGMGSVVETLKANVTMLGDYDGTFSCDVTITMDAAYVTSTSGSVSMVINGTVTADGQTFTFNNETFQVSASNG